MLSNYNFCTSSLIVSIEAMPEFFDNNPFDFSIIDFEFVKYKFIFDDNSEFNIKLHKYDDFIASFSNFMFLRRDKKSKGVVVDQMTKLTILNFLMQYKIPFEYVPGENNE